MKELYKMEPNNTEVKQNETVVNETTPKPDADAIFCIVNRGFTDLVMTAARKVGAGGGTIIHARGTGNTQLENFYGIVVSPEKEIVVIVVKKEMTDKILLAINSEAGLDSPGQGIAFALPVSDYHGINFNNKL